VGVGPQYPGLVHPGLRRGRIRLGLGIQVILKLEILRLADCFALPSHQIFLCRTGIAVVFRGFRIFCRTVSGPS